MSDLDLTIELDPAPSVTAAKKVVAEFGKAEDQGVKAKQAYESLSQTFRRLGQAMLEESRRGEQAIGNLGSALARVARYQQILADEERKQTAAALGSVRAFEGMAEALRREQQVIDRIHGPMRQHQQDIVVLNKLLAEGKISADQHAAALAKSAASAGVNSGLQGGSKQLIEKLTGAPSLGAFAGGLIGGAVGGNAVSLLSRGISSLIDKWGEHDRAVSAAEKSLRGLFETTGETAGAVAALDAAAAHAGASLKDMTPVYAAVNEASEKWYLTTLDQVNVTESLANLARKSGREIETATTFIKAFGAATADNVVTSTEFRQLVKAFPEAIDAWAESLGLSRQELQALLERSKDARTQIDAFYGSLRDGVPVSERAREGIAGINGGARWLAETMERAREGNNHFWNDFNRAIEENQRRLDDLNHRQFKDFISGINGIRDAAKGAWIEVGRLVNDPWGDSKLDKVLGDMNQKAKDLDLALKESGRGGAKEFHDKIDALNRVIKEQPEYAGIAEEAIRKLESRHKSAAKTADATREAFKKMFSTMGLGPNIEYQRHPGVARQNAIDAANNAAFLEQQHAQEVERAARYAYAANGAPVDQTSGFMTPEQIMASANTPRAIKEVSDFQRALDNLNNSAVESLKGAAHSLGDAFVDAFTRADFSASEFFKSLGANLLKQGISSLISFGFDAWSPKKGGATGFDALVGQGSGAFLPGFATGGDMLVGGAGGTDSRIAMFRVTPNESIHVRTPEQRREAAAATAPRSVTINIPGQTGAITEHNVEGLLIRIVEQNAPAFRRRLGLG